MVNILFISTNLKPDIGPCAIRSDLIIKGIEKNYANNNFKLDVITNYPSRYNSFKIDFEENIYSNNVNILRLNSINFKNEFINYGFFFIKAFFFSIKTKKKYDHVICTSSKLMTGFLGYIVSKIHKCNLHLDIRDIFIENIKQIYKNKTFTFLFIFFDKIEKKIFEKAKSINLISEGFFPYFSNKYKDISGKFTNFGHGIDTDFFEISKKKNALKKNTQLNKKLILTYIGNIGRGQSLSNILIGLSNQIIDYELRIIGDGSEKILFEKQVKDKKIKNIIFLNPMERNLLIDYYYQSDILFLHLDKIKAFEKVIPSKIFEYSIFNKPILAGVAGHPKKFIEENITDSHIFEPNNILDAFNQIKNIDFNKTIDRSEFFVKFKYENIIDRYIQCILHSND